MSRVLRAAATGITILLAVLVLAACGSDSDSAAGDAGSGSAAGAQPVSLVSDAFSDSHPVTSGRLDLHLRVDVKGETGATSLSGPLSVRLRGPFATGAEGTLPTFDLDAEIELGTTKISAGLISTGNRIWLNYAGTAYELPSSIVEQYKQAYERAEKRGGDKRTTLASLGIDPSAWLEDAKVVGDERVGGDEATHVSADVDVAKLLDDLSGLLERSGVSGKTLKLPQGLGSGGSTSATLSEQARKDIERSISSAAVDVWTGKDDSLLRRLRVAVAFAVPDDARSSANGLSSGSFLLDLTITDLNKDQTITAPADARPFSELQPLLSSVLA